MAAVRAVLSDPRFSRAETRRLGISTAGAAIFEQEGILDLDPPEHSRLRRLVAAAFSARRIRELRPRIQEITGELIDGLRAATPPADLNPALCLPLPIAVICEILGVPYTDRDQFRGWSERVMATGAFSSGEAMEALIALAGYMSGLIAAKRDEPDGSLLTALIAARDDEDRLSEEELLLLSISLLVAGHETTANMIGMGLVALLDHPDQLAALRANPELAPAAVDEVLRLVPLGIHPDSGLVRATTSDVELEGVTIPAHCVVRASTAAANLDPAEFPDPGRIDLTRVSSGHVAFGHGPHHCLGAQLARLEMDVAFTSLLAAFPDLRLAVPVTDLAYKDGMLVTGLASLPVAW